MSGKELKAKLQATGKSISAIAELLGKSPQALNTILNVADVKTGTLEELCDALGVEMSYFYPSKNAVQVTNNDNAHHNTATGNVSSDTVLLDALKDVIASNKKKDEQIDTLLSMMQQK